MATAQITEIIDGTVKLRSSCKDLKRELSILDSYLRGDDIIVITHDCSSVIRVYSTNRLRAYVPRKYNSFTVEFTEIVAGEELKFDLKEEILA